MITFGKFPKIARGEGDNGSSIYLDDVEVGRIEREVEWKDTGSTSVSYTSYKVLDYIVSFWKHVGEDVEDKTFATLAAARSYARARIRSASGESNKAGGRPVRYVVRDAGRSVVRPRSRVAAHRATRTARYFGASVNRSNGDDDLKPYQIILQQMGGAGRLRAMIGAQLSYADDGKRLDIQFPNRIRSKANFVQVRYDPGSDTYTMIFWRIDRMGAGKQLRELNDVYSDSLVEIFERETGLYLRI